MEADAIIIGSGVLGVSLAFHLGNQGSRVILLEREAAPAASSSGKNAGMIRHLYRHPQITEWTKRSTTLWPADVHQNYFRRTGSLIVGRTVPFHHTDLFEQARYSKGTDGGREDVPAVYTPSDGLLDYPGYHDWLLENLNRTFVTTVFKTGVTSVQRCSGYWEVRTADGRMFYAPWLVNAAGAWLNDFLGTHHPWLCMNAKRFVRYFFLIKGWPKGYMPAENSGFFWDEQDGWYVRPWDGDTALTALCDQVPLEDPSGLADAGEAAQCMSAILDRTLAPGTARKMQIEKSWHCLRTYAPDMLPIFGEDRDISGLFWLAGFGGVGLSTSFAATLDAAGIIAGERIEVSQDLCPDRAKLTPLSQRLKVSAAPAGLKLSAQGERSRAVF